MKKATLNYVIRDLDNELRFLPLETSSLVDIDRFTSQYNSASDLISKYAKKEKIMDFSRNFGSYNGQLRIMYAKNIYDKKDLMPLYNFSDEILMNDDFENGRFTEVEKARKLLFNSHGQLFAEMLLNCKSISDSYNYRLSLSYHEYLIAKKCGLAVGQEDGVYYTNFSQLLKYRFFNKRLGPLREVYEDMIDIWKDKIMELSDDDFYYYSRQLRLLMSRYENARFNRISINNLKILKNVSFIEPYSLQSNNYVVFCKDDIGKKKVA